VPGRVETAYLLDHSIADGGVIVKRGAVDVQGNESGGSIGSSRRVVAGDQAGMSSRSGVLAPVARSKEVQAGPAMLRGLRFRRSWAMRLMTARRMATPVYKETAGISPRGRVS
jgi:hypothetical protein